jgi:superfamily II DNA or RNA helicase
MGIFVPIVVDSRVRFPASSVPPAVLESIRATFTKKNPKHEALRRQKIRGWWAEPAEIVGWAQEGDEFSIPRGSFRRLVEIFGMQRLSDNPEIRYGVSDRRALGYDAPEIGDTTVDLRDYQQRIVDRCLARENCLVKSTTASGKTTALLALAGRLKTTTLVIVHTNALAEQWAERAVSELGMESSQVGLLGGGKRQGDRPLTIGTTKSVAAALEADPEFAGRWGAVFADEVHLFAARTFYELVDKFPARYRVGVSDDQRRKDRKEFMIEWLFGEVAEEVRDAEVLDAGYVMAVETMIIPTDFRADWYGFPEEGSDEDKTPDYGRLIGEMTADEERNALIESTIAGELAQSRQVLAMSDTREHCMAIGAFCARHAPSGHLVGGPDFKSEFRRTIAGMKSGRLRAGAGTFQACGTGVDIPGVEIVVAATPVLSNKSKYRQGRGRAMRKPAGKTVARYYAFWDRHVFGIRHLANAVSWAAPGPCFVWDGDRWVDGKSYLKAERARGREKG